MTPLVDLPSLSLAFFLTGSTSKLFHRRIVSSAATVATVEQSGLRVKLRTRSSWPTIKKPHHTFRPAKPEVQGFQFTACHFKVNCVWTSKNKFLTSELCNPGERGVLPDSNVVVCIAMGRDQLLVIRCKHQWRDLKKLMRFWGEMLVVATKLKLYYIWLRTTETKTGLEVCGYLGLSVKWTDAGAAIYIPDADVTVTCTTSRCEDIWLPWTPS